MEPQDPNPTSAPTTGFVVFDLAGLRYRFTASSLSVFSPAGELLAVLDLPSSWDRRTAAFHGCEQVLERGFVRRNGRRLRIALYNPLSAQVAVSATPDTQVFCDKEALEFPTHGIEAQLGPDGLIVAGRVLPLAQITFASLTRSLVAHDG